MINTFDERKGRKGKYGKERKNDENIYHVKEDDDNTKLKLYYSAKRIIYNEIQ